jgi:hypothetical protein
MNNQSKNLQKAQDVLDQCQPFIEQINTHPLYASIHTLDHLRIFMQYHVFAVWDFMCLLKELYQRMVSTRAPWLPPKDAYSARLLGRILLEEEGDLSEDGQYTLSHYELYLAAMTEIGADTQPIHHFIHAFNNPGSMMLTLWDTPESARRFLATTFDFFGAETHELAAAFVYGREAITETMFTPLLASLQQSLPAHEQRRLGTLKYYLRRHIELDHDNHFPQALAMLTRLVGEDSHKWQSIATAANRALQARLNFLTAIQQIIQKA